MIVSGDSDGNGFKSTCDGMPWVALKFQYDQKSINEKIPCTGYPTPGVVNLANGTVIEPDAFGKVNEGSVGDWLKAIE